MADFELTKDGDLAIGEQEVNEEGKPLYYVSGTQYMPGYVTDSPLETSIPIRDISLVSGYEETLQWMRSIFKTDSPDWSLYPDLGANISDFMGELNNQATAKKLEDVIVEAFTEYSEIDQDDIEIESIPISESEILLMIKLMRVDQQAYDFNFIMNLEVGVLNYYETEGDLYK